MPCVIHRGGQLLDELRRVLVDRRREIDRARGERGHVGLQRQRRAALLRVAAAAAGGELDDHAGAALPDAGLHLGEQRRVRGRCLVGVAHVDVDEGCAGLVGLARRLDLLGRRDRHAGIVPLAGQRAGDGDRDDDGPWHDSIPYRCPDIVAQSPPDRNSGRVDGAPRLRRDEQHDADLGRSGRFRGAVDEWAWDAAASRLPTSADVVVIGGGIVGCSAAWFLARRGRAVVLCEKGRIAGEQSGRNWGWVRQQGRSPVELPLMMRSLAIWKDLRRGARRGRRLSPGRLPVPRRGRGGARRARGVAAGRPRARTRHAAAVAARTRPACCTARASAGRRALYPQRRPRGAESRRAGASPAPRAAPAPPS